MKLFSLSAWRRAIATAMMASLLIPSIAKAAALGIPNETAASSVEEPQPKFIWGILIKFAAGKAFDLLFEWASTKLFHGMTFSSFLHLNDAVSPPDAATQEPVSKGMVPITPNVTTDAPSSPLLTENGKENYQGLILSLLVLQADGQTLKVRPLGEGFKSGEKFRIRIGATFNGEFSLDTINPKGERSRLYPANAAQIIKLKAAVPVILPLTRNDFFQFDDDAGEEKLVFTLRDPRALGDALAQTRVYRQENAQGTGLLQEVAAGKYPAIAESISLQHRQ